MGEEEKRSKHRGPTSAELSAMPFFTVTPPPEPPHWWATIVLPHQFDIGAVGAVDVSRS